MDTVFNKIDKFQAMCELTNNTKSDNQLVSIAYLIFSRCRVFIDTLKKWNSKQADEKTYLDMVIHMRDEHQALREVGALTIHDSQVNQALMLQQLSTQQEQLAETIKSDISDQLKSSLMETLNLLKDPTLQQPVQEINTLSTESANSVSTGITMDSILSLFKNLEKKVDNLNTPGNNGNTLTAPPSINQDINPKSGKPWRRYCWTCGCCTHWSKNCVIKAPGHKDNATFKNRMGGSDKNCL